MYRHLLVPVDDTMLGAELVSDALDLARQLQAKVTFLHVTGRQEESLYGDAALLRVTAPDEFNQAYRWIARSVLSRAEAGARALGVEHDVRIASSHGALHESILEAAREAGCDLIVMASHERSSRLAQLMRSNAVAVMTRTDIPFLLAIPGSNHADATRRAVTRIRDEHRTIAAVLDGLLRRLDQGSAEKLDEGERNIAVASLRFLAEFAGKQHHPKEEEYLFARLEPRSDPQLRALMGELRRQHLGEQQLLLSAEAALAGSRSEVRNAVEALARHVFRHMAQEETEILSEARRMLTVDDWAALHEAFSGHTDPRFESETEQERQEMYKWLVNQLPA